ILLGPAYHFELTRPGIGLYGGLPFDAARAVARLSIPIIQVREVATNQSVGYGDAWRAHRPARIATLSAGYADGLLRQLTNSALLFDGDTPCPLVGRVSMDLITVDISHLRAVPDALDILCEQQGIDHLATLGGTIGYEILTSLGPRYQRRYKGR
ncbi:MAG: alanine racemase, partial [Paracoccaceae bacterium]